MVTVSYPTSERNYCLFDTQKINNYVLKGEKALPAIETSLKHPESEEQVLESLYTLNLMLDNGIDKKKISELYPVLSEYNNTDSPNVQTYLAGIYRKTHIPDAFGPLVKMLIQNSVYPKENANFDPNEEIGGAILDYLA